MSVLIKGIEMPTGCKDCIFVNRRWYGGDICQILKREVTGNVERGGFQTDCPLVPVPPHGDLIDRDVAYDKIAEQEGGNYVDMDAVDMGLSETPVIIPEDDAWPEWRTQVLGIRQQEES